MQAIMETLFDIVYLSTAIILGILILRKSKNEKQYKLFGVMAIILGCGDAFHLVPRALALNTTGLLSYAVPLGFGKLVTSITMTFFYVMLYHVWVLRYEKKVKGGLTVGIYALAIVRIALCLFPQNDWLSADSPISWGIYRNIPFFILGLIIIVIYYIESSKNKDKSFRFMWLAITLSFIFYIPVVLWADTFPLVGMLMIPKTCAYVWMLCMGYSAVKTDKKLSRR